MRVVAHRSREDRPRSPRDRRLPGLPTRGHLASPLRARTLPISHDRARRLGQRPGIHPLLGADSEKTKRRVRCSGRYERRRTGSSWPTTTTPFSANELIHWLPYANYGFGDGLHEIRAYWDNCARGTKGWTWNDVLGP